MTYSGTANVQQSDSVNHTAKTISENPAGEWAKTSNIYNHDIRQLVHDIVKAHKAPLTDVFYHQMMKDSAASFFLSDSLVKSKLGQTMQVWLTMVFPPASTQSFTEVVHYQEKIGAVHARIGIPPHLVMRGMRALNQGIFDLLEIIDTDRRHTAITYVTEISNFATEIMCHAYARFHERNSRAEESYRLFAISQDIGSEKERQRAALLDWENELMFNMTMDTNKGLLPKLSNCEFGLWFLHKAAYIFEGSKDVPKIDAFIRSIDKMIDGVTPDSSHSQRIEMLLSIREKTKSVNYLVGKLFEQESTLDAGKDTLTKLLNRKYLAVIMNREITYARKNNTQLAVLALDIDFFKKINDTHGHDVGDLVLQYVSTTMHNMIRGSDYIFRTGGEEFLITFPNISQRDATNVAEKIRRRIETEKLVINDKLAISLTVSMGLAFHNGHPDYTLLLKTADEMLYKAKQNGRNQVVTSLEQD